jgi:hypothetical protein
VTGSDLPDFDTGSAGASARREHLRRKANREARVRSKHPVIGGMLLALSEDPQHEKAWGRGAGGEERVAEALAKHLHDDVVVLHDRRAGRSSANIDHIAVAPSGVWVIDAKRYRGKLAVSAPLLGKSKLRIAGRDQTKLVDGLAKQVALVRTAMADIAPGIPVHGALCFVDTELPLLGPRTFRSFWLLHPKPLAKRINRPGPLDAAQVPGVADELARRFRAA